MLYGQPLAKKKKRYPPTVLGAARKFYGSRGGGRGGTAQTREERGVKGQRVPGGCRRGRGARKGGGANSGPDFRPPRIGPRGPVGAATKNPSAKVGGLCTCASTFGYVPGGSGGARSKSGKYRISPVCKETKNRSVGRSVGPRSTISDGRVAPKISFLLCGREQRGRKGAPPGAFPVG